MAWTFGGATSDKLVTTGNVQLAASSSMFLAGWFYPTTLTAARVLWAETATSKIVIGSPTNLLQITLDKSTTDNVINIDVGLQANVWQFIALAISVNASSVGVAHGWVGTTDIPPNPTAIVGTQVQAGSGSLVSTVAHCIGNLNTIGTVAFQGDIGQIIHIVAQQTAPNQGLSIATAGTITAADDLNIFNNLVNPLYNGILPMEMMLSPASVAVVYAVDIYDLGCQPPMVVNLTEAAGVTTDTTPLVMTPSGAVWTEARQPREWEIQTLAYRNKR